MVSAMAQFGNRKEAFSPARDALKGMRLLLHITDTNATTDTTATTATTATNMRLHS
jgi:hypothetical protein